MRDEAFLLDMLIAARKVVKHIDGVTRPRFMTDETLQNTVAYQIQIIGEAARRVTVEYQRVHEELPWAHMVGMRHRIVHDYRDLDLEILWSTATRDVPELVTLLEPLVPPDEAD